MCCHSIVRSTLSARVRRHPTPPGGRGAAFSHDKAHPVFPPKNLFAVKGFHTHVSGTCVQCSLGHEHLLTPDRPSLHMLSLFYLFILFVCFFCDASSQWQKSLRRSLTIRQGKKILVPKDEKRRMTYTLFRLASGNLNRRFCRWLPTKHSCNRESNTSELTKSNHICNETCVNCMLAQIGLDIDSQARIQDSGQGGPTEFWPQGGPWAQKLKIGVFPWNCLKTAWFWRNPGSKGAQDPLLTPLTRRSASGRGRSRGRSSWTRAESRRGSTRAAPGPMSAAPGTSCTRVRHTGSRTCRDTLKYSKPISCFSRNGKRQRRDRKRRNASLVDHGEFMLTLHWC